MAAQLFLAHATPLFWPGGLYTSDLATEMVPLHDVLFQSRFFLWFLGLVVLLYNGMNKTTSTRNQNKNLGCSSTSCMDQGNLAGGPLVTYNQPPSQPVLARRHYMCIRKKLHPIAFPFTSARLSHRSICKVLSLCTQRKENNLYVKRIGSNLSEHIPWYLMSVFEIYRHLYCSFTFQTPAF